MNREQAEIIVAMASKGHQKEAIGLLAFWGFGKFRAIDPEEDLLGLIKDKLVKFPAQRARKSFLRQFIRELQVLEPAVVEVSTKPKKPFFKLERPQEVIKELKRSPMWKVWEQSTKKVVFVTKRELKDTKVDHDDLVLVAEIYPKKKVIEFYLAHLNQVGVLHLKYNFFDEEDQKFFPEGTVFNWEISPSAYQDDADWNDVLMYQVEMAININEDEPEAPQPDDNPEPLSTEFRLTQRFAMTMPQFLDFITTQVQEMAEEFYEANQGEITLPLNEWLLNGFGSFIHIDRFTRELIHPSDWKLWVRHFRPTNRHGFEFDWTS